MAKTCLIEDCNNPRFGKGYCGNHQYHRKDLNPTRLKRTSLNKLNPKKTKLRHPTGELAMFLEIWEDMETPRKCNHCGRPQFIFRVDSFAHIKPKGTHPELRLNKNNIWFSCSYFDDKHGWYGCHTSQTFESIEKFNARKDSYKK